MINTWFTLADTSSLSSGGGPRSISHTLVRIQFIVEVGGMVNEPRLQVLIGPGLKEAVVSDVSSDSYNLIWCCPLCREETTHNCC